MTEVQIGPYVRERDCEALTGLLREDPLQAETALPAMENYPEGVYVARLDNRLVGCLAVNGFKRRTNASVYVTPALRRQGIGTALLRLADGLFAGNEAVELSTGICLEDDRDAIQVLYRHGYYRGHGALTMERRGEALPVGGFVFRAYEDADYPIWHRVYESAFWPMRAATGQLPLYWFPPSERERQSLAADRENHYVLVAEGEIAAIGGVTGGKPLVAVRHDLQRRGYGRAMMSFLVNTIMERGKPVVELGVVQGNPAIFLYESLGFAVTERLACMKRYYRPDTIPSAPPEGFFGQ